MKKKDKKRRRDRDWDEWDEMLNNPEAMYKYKERKREERWK